MKETLRSKEKSKKKESKLGLLTNKALKALFLGAAGNYIAGPIGGRFVGGLLGSVIK